jgi:hypothetical protein
MWKKIILGISIVICIAAGIYWFTYIKEIKTPVSSGINAVPLDAALIFESKQTANAWVKLASGDMWKELMGTATGTKLNRQVHYLDSLFRSAPAVGQLLMNQSVFISVHSSGPSSFDFLYVYSLPNLGHQSTVKGFIKKVNNNKEPDSRAYDDVEINTIHPPHKDSLSFAFLNGILMMSTNQTLVEDAIRQLKSGVSFSKDKNFNKVISTAGKNVDGNIYVNYKKFPNLLNNFIFPGLQEEAKNISNFADYSGWDITIKNNALLFSGFTQANDSSNSFLRLFATQDPQEIELTKIIPAKTAFLFFMGINDVKTFHHDYKIYLNYKQRSQQYEQYVTDINKKYHVNIERCFLDWIKNEMALVITEPTTATIADNSYAILHANNITDADHTLNALTDSICKKNSEKKDTIHVGDYVITHLNLPGVLSELFGWQFEKINKNYYTTVDDYVVFANSSAALQTFIHDFENNKTLEKDKRYRTFMENISGDANIYLYAAAPRLLGISGSIVNEELNLDVNNQRELLQKFDKFGIQFSTNKKLFYSGACISYNSLYGQELKPEWELKLDTSFQVKPFIVDNSRTNTKDIFIQDDTNTVYLANARGKLSWKRSLHEAMISNAFQPIASKAKNSKLQILFNTATQLYKLDENGRDSKGFPVQLKSHASNPMNMVSYEKNNDYRILLAFEDKTIHCFNPHGEEVTGFKSIKTDNPVTLPVQYFKVNTKDYLCVVDVEGKIYITDRQGEMRIKLKERFPQAIEHFYIESGSDKDHTFLVTADSTGKVTKIALNDAKEQFRPQRFDLPVIMEYKDIDKDGISEYIFQSKTELNIYNQQKQLLVNHKFKDDMLPATILLDLPDGSTRIGAVSAVSNQLYLFNASGSSISNFPAKGKTLFTIADLANDGVLYLISGTPDNKLVAYPLE